MKLKEELTAESVAVEEAVRNGDFAAAKAARLRFENKHRAYWNRVKAARKAVDKGAQPPKDIDPMDLMEVAPEEG